MLDDDMSLCQTPIMQKQSSVLSNPEKTGAANGDHHSNNDICFALFRSKYMLEYKVCVDRVK